MRVVQIQDGKNNSRFGYSYEDGALVLELHDF